MTGATTRCRKAAALLLLLGGAAHTLARADGPHIAFHETGGAYTVTLFSAPDPLVTGPVALNLLVQNGSDGALAPSATASGRLTLAGHAPVPFQLTPGGAANPQLLGSTVALPTPGDYALTLEVTGSPGSGNSGVGPLSFHGTLPVEPNHDRRDIVLWAVFLPLGLVGLFLANQYAKQEMRRRRVPVARS